MMHGHERSDLAIVAMKPANKAEQPTAEVSAGANAAEPVERRAGTEGNAGQQSTCRAQNRISVAQALERIRKVQAQGTVLGNPRLSPASTAAPSRGESWLMTGVGRCDYVGRLRDRLQHDDIAHAFLVLRGTSHSLSDPSEHVTDGRRKPLAAASRRDTPLVQRACDGPQ